MNRYSRFTVSKKLIVRIFAVLCICVGATVAGYIFLPLILWQIFLAPVFNQQAIATPIPRTVLVTPNSIKSLISSQASTFGGVDYTDAKNWFPGYTKSGGKARVNYYTISISKINLTNAVVSTVDDDLAKHLVNFAGTSVPPEKGNTVVFGHSTLPQLYNPRDYKTIFAKIHEVSVGDTILVNVNSILYTYKIFSITIVDPSDTSVLAQTVDDSYLTLITCTPPGTIWERLVIKSRLQTL